MAMNMQFDEKVFAGVNFAIFSISQMNGFNVVSMTTTGSAEG